MPRIHSLLLCSALFVSPFVSLFPAHAEGEGNPQVEKLGDAVILYASFDNETTDADLATIDGKDKTPVKGATRFVKGVYGKGIIPDEKGLPQYVTKGGEFSFERPGSALIWISPQDWDREQPEEYIFFLRFNAANGQVILAKSNMQGRSDRLYVYAKGGGSEKGGSVSAGSTSEWLNNDWHLLAVNWGTDWVSISVDGGEFVQMEVPELQNYGEIGRVILGSKEIPHRRVVYDELLFLNRPLSNEEVSEIYSAGTSASQK